MTNIHPIFQKELDAILEECANLEHERWSRWQKYLHSLFPKNVDGGITITKERVEHWERQIATSYSELSEKEKEYDRVEVRKYYPLFLLALKRASMAVVEEATGGIYDMFPVQIKMENPYYWKGYRDTVGKTLSTARALTETKK